MKFGTLYRQGEIIIIPFPFSDLSGTKQRPVLILSKNEDNSKSDDIIACGITSNLKDSKYSVFISDENIIAGSISTKSKIKVDKLFTVEKGIIKKRLAEIDNSTFNKVRQEFLKLI